MIQWLHCQWSDTHRAPWILYFRYHIYIYITAIENFLFRNITSFFFPSLPPLSLSLYIYIYIYIYICINYCYMQMYVSKYLKKSYVVGRYRWKKREKIRNILLQEKKFILFNRPFLCKQNPTHSLHLLGDPLYPANIFRITSFLLNLFTPLTFKRPPTVSLEKSPDERPLLVFIIKYSLFFLSSFIYIPLLHMISLSILLFIYIVGQ